MTECAREIQWAGGKHTFDLGEKRTFLILQHRGLPGQFGSTPAACMKRFEEGVYSISDVERVIELGLLGGRVPQAEVQRLLDAHVRRKPLAPNALLAVAILSALFVEADHGTA